MCNRMTRREREGRRDEGRVEERESARSRVRARAEGEGGRERMAVCV